MSLSTPKFKSAEFREVLEALKQIFDAHSLGIVLLDAFERKAAEQVYTRNLRAAGGRSLQAIPKVELIGQITGWFFGVEAVAYQVVKEMDRATMKERHIVSSIPEEQAAERIGSYRAISLKRERAKLVWALARDERPTVRELASKVINEFFREVADLERARDVIGGGDTSLVDDVELAKRIQSQAERLAEASHQVSALEGRLSAADEERARLLAEMGSKERSLKQATAAHAELEHELSGLKGKLKEIEDNAFELQLARDREAQARARADELASKVRRLERLAGAAEVLTDAQSELERLRRRTAELGRALERAGEERAAAIAEAERERERAKSESEALRAELGKARRRLAELEPLALRVEAPPSDVEEKVLVLLDQANLAASAHETWGRKVNFGRLLERVLEGRRLHRAVAFVVDNGGAAFGDFCETLRRSGFDVRVKRPKRFADGTGKADWDMGIAIEAIERRDEARTVVLATGDGDFVPLVKHLRRFGQGVEAAAFASGLAQELALSVERVIRLDEGVLE